MNQPTKRYCYTDTARTIATLINRFDRKCRDAQHTDTEEAWSLLRRIRQLLRPRRQRRRKPRVLAPRSEHTTR